MTTSANARVDKDEVARFDRLARDWWDERGPMKPLHKINPVRVAFLKDRICAHFGRDARAIDALSDLTILDIGCGGGILSEPLARMGARVTGVDPAGENIAVARAHAEDQGLSVTYHHGLAEDLAAEKQQFDVVLAMEVVEHVPDVPAFLRTAAALTRPGGFFGGSTLNRTLRSFALAIVGAEYVLRWLPVGTHRWEKFVTPDEFSDALSGAGFRPDAAEGMVFDPLRDRWRLSRDTGVNYFLTAGKPD
ncbi:MAG: bifunctional 2-polyprenyl-6-hydroxyphenol methylase/3-demethylubiquinol 3-O-methyltransferase UbiG [Proteobacteria bacterium]|nr:bifunctional 2-polyprenyl-6-hydroxyphenol methylase/3-demethylubiquinol 3-O-methyltransferase UbiG [Pseudomonadota bacterium]